MIGVIPFCVGFLALIGAFPRTYFIFCMNVLTFYKVTDILKDHKKRKLKSRL